MSPKIRLFNPQAVSCRITHHRGFFVVVLVGLFVSLSNVI